MRSETISVLIPAYNESCRIKPTLAAVAQYLAAHWAEYEIVVVDDGSSDDTAEIVAGMAATLRNVHLISTGRTGVRVMPCGAGCSRQRATLF